MVCSKLIREGKQVLQKSLLIHHRTFNYVDEKKDYTDVSKYSEW
jgi:hypothetical protein